MNVTQLNLSQVFKFPILHIKLLIDKLLKAGLSPSKNNCLICFIENPVKVIKNAFYFILDTLFVLKIFKFLC